MTLPTLRLKRNEDKRLTQGHLWIYSNEVDTKLTPLKPIDPGALVKIQNAAGANIGLAFASPQSLICARLISRDVNATIDSAFFHKRLQQALTLRQRQFDQPYYRLIHGEGDFLPGLVIDRHGDDSLARAWLGGVAQKVIGLVDMPVLVSVKGDTDGGVNG